MVLDRAEISKMGRTSIAACRGSGRWTVEECYTERGTYQVESACHAESFVTAKVPSHNPKRGINVYPESAPKPARSVA